MIMLKLACLLCSLQLGSSALPNYVYIMADDIGFSDVGFNNATNAITPTLDQLAMNEGMILNRFYVMPVCTPTRAALMTGRYPGRYGLQNGAISSSQAYGVPLDEVFLPEELKRAGYVNYLVGKYHLGFFQEDYLPTKRGFDFFLGHYSSGIGKWDSWHKKGYDFRLNTTCVPIPENFTGQYATDIYSDAVESILNSHNQSDPFYLQLSFSVPHSPIDSTFEQRERYKDLNITTPGRVEYLAMVSKMDAVINNTVSLLKSLGLWENTLLVWSSDNGGASYGVRSSNHPLRGAKTMLWEGGVRSPAFVSGGLLPEAQRGSSFNGLIFVADWFLTFVLGAQLNATRSLAELDAYDLNPMIANSSAGTEREYIILNVDWEESSGCNHTIRGEPMCGAIIYGDHKASIGHGIDIRASIRSGWNYDLPDRTKVDVSHSRVQCGAAEVNAVWNIAKDECPFLGVHKTRPCVYDLATDPCEVNDIYGTFSVNNTVYEKMIDLLFEYKDLFVNATNPHMPSDPAANPRLFPQRCWTPWK